MCLLAEIGGLQVFSQPGFKPQPAIKWFYSYHLIKFILKLSQNCVGTKSGKRVISLCLSDKDSLCSTLSEMKQK